MIKGYSLLFLFMLPFLGIGIWMGYETVKTINQVEAAHAWTETPAEITSCVLESHRGSKGSVSYRIRGQFTYTFNGKKYRSDKVSFYTSSDNVGRFHQRIFHQLESARLSKKTLPCWVNPKDPYEAVLIRDLRPEMMGFQLLFVFFFGGAAFAVLSGALFTAFKKGPNAGKIRMLHSGIHRPLLLAGGVTLGGGLWLVWKAVVLVGSLSSTWYLLVALIPGVVLTGFGLYTWRRFAKFGVSELILSPSTIRINDRITATVLIPRLVEGDFKGRLACTHQYITGSGKHRKTHRNVVWSEEMMSSGSPGGEQMTQLPFRFELKGGHVTEERGDTSYYWRLLVTADRPGVDYKAEFDVTVGA